MQVQRIGSFELSRHVDVLELITALTGYEPVPVDIHQITMHCANVSKQDIQLRRIISKDQDHSMVYQFGRPPWGDLYMAKLPATVYTVTKSSCSGPDVPGFWKELGFSVRYQHYKRGHVADLRLGKWTVQILISTLHRVVEPMEEDQLKRRYCTLPRPGDQISPGQILIEAWVDVDEEASVVNGPGKDKAQHFEAMDALVEFSNFLAPLGVVMGPIPDARKLPAQQRLSS